MNDAHSSVSLGSSNYIPVRILTLPPEARKDTRRKPSSRSRMKVLAGLGTGAIVLFMVTTVLGVVLMLNLFFVSLSSSVRQIETHGHQTLYR